MKVRNLRVGDQLGFVKPDPTGQHRWLGWDFVTLTASRRATLGRKAWYIEWVGGAAYLDPDETVHPDAWRKRPDNEGENDD